MTDKIFEDSIEELARKGKVHRASIKFSIHLDMDLNFWAITPTIALNLYSKTLEFEWLCFALYIDKID